MSPRFLYPRISYMLAFFISLHFLHLCTHYIPASFITPHSIHPCFLYILTVLAPLISSYPGIPYISAFLTSLLSLYSCLPYISATQISGGRIRSRYWRKRLQDNYQRRLCQATMGIRGAEKSRRFRTPSRIYCGRSKKQNQNQWVYQRRGSVLNCIMRHEMIFYLVNAIIISWVIWVKFVLQTFRRYFLRRKIF